MALSEQEQKRLEQLEASLLADDPSFAEALRGTSQIRIHRRRATLAGLAFLLGLTALVGGVQLNPLVSILGFVVMLAAAILGISAWSRIEGQESGARPKQPRKPAPPQTSADFMAKLEERWRKRQQGDL